MLAKLRLFRVQLNFKLTTKENKSEHIYKMEYSVVVVRAGSNSRYENIVQSAHG